MTDRDAELRALRDSVRARDAVVDAFLAKSFTDRLLILDVRQGETVPDAVAERLAEHDLRPAAAVYGDAGEGSALGPLADADRHHFVDVRTRGTHQSYVVE